MIVKMSVKHRLSGDDDAAAYLRPSKRAVLESQELHCFGMVC